MKRYYSPQIDREVVSALYHEAKARGIPMTRLANRLLHAALRYEGVERENGGEHGVQCAILDRGENPGAASIYF